MDLGLRQITVIHHIVEMEPGRCVCAARLLPRRRRWRREIEQIECDTQPDKDRPEPADDLWHQPCAFIPLRRYDQCIDENHEQNGVEGEFTIQIIAPEPEASFRYLTGAPVGSTVAHDRPYDAVDRDQQHDHDHRAGQPVPFIELVGDKHVLLDHLAEYEPQH